jgi:arylsulfatase A-like enzyme
MSDPINVLFITADQWRGDCLSALGHPTVKTPHLDALAGDGVLFRNHFTQGVPCGPSRASLYSGMYLMNHRSVRNGVPLDARFTNIALEARKAGYHPALIGYTDTSLDPRAHHPKDPALSTYTGVLPGFTQMVPGSEDSHNSAWRRYLAAKGYEISLGADEIRSPAPSHAAEPGRGPTFAPAFYKAEHSDTAFMFDRALAYVAARDHRPWFLHLSVERPHPPFIAPEPYNALYDPEEVPGFMGAASAEDEARQHPYLAYLIRHHLERDSHDPERHPATEPARRQLRATYYGLMSEVDHHFGRLMALLKERGLYDNTLIVFTSDHGEQLWDHWLLGKEAYFDQSFHVPLIVRAPGGPAEPDRGRVVEAFTEHVDVMPTILELIGGECPLQCDGASLSAFLAGRTPDSWRQEVHWELDFRDVVTGRPENELGLGLDDCALTVIRDRRFKYIHFNALPPLFFDLAQDPDERHDLAGDPAQAANILAYAQKMLSWRGARQERVLTGIRLTAAGPFECPPERR